MKLHSGNKLLLVAVFIFSLYATDTAAMYNLSSKDGLGNDRVTDMARDGRGYLWFVTKAGIDRYDGVNFISYNVKGNGIVADSTHVFTWCNDGSIKRYSELEDKWLDYACIPDAIIHAACMDWNGDMLVGTSHGLYRVQSDSGVVGISVVDECESFNINAISRGDTGELWIGLSDGLVRIKDGEVYRLPVDGIFVQSLLYEKVLDRLWVGTYSRGVHIYDIENDTMIPLSSVPDRYPVRSIIVADSVHIWVGTDGNGIYLIDRTTLERSGQMNTHGGNSGYRIDGNGVYRLLNDGELIWICTFSGGVNIYDKNAFRFDIYSRFGDNGSRQLQDQCVNAILEDSHGDIWFGTNNGVSVYSPADGSWRYFLLADNTEKNPEYCVVLSLMEDDSHNIWAGGYAMGAVLMDRYRGPVKRFLASSTGMASNDIFDICQDMDGNIWLGGIRGPLCRYDSRTGKFSRYAFPNIQIIKNIPRKRLLAAAVDAAYLIDYNNDVSVEALLTSDDLEGALINSVEYRDDTDILISTDKGIFAYNLHERKLSDRYKSYCRYASVSFADSIGRTWVGTYNGMVCIDDNSGIRLHVTEQDGLPGSVFNKKAVCQLNDGSVILGLTKGAVRFRAEEIYSIPQKYPMYFTSFKVSDKSSDPYYARINHDLEKPGRILLKPHQNSVSVSFACLDFNSRDNVTYKWKMDGPADVWSDETAENYVHFFSLPPGIYRFSVKSYVNSLFNSEISLDFRIRPVFWKSPAAFCLYTMLLILFVFLFVKMKKNRLETLHAEEKIAFFINVAHEIRTPVMLIKAPLKDIMERMTSHPAVYSSLALAVRNTDRLLNIVNHLLDFQDTGQKQKLLVEKIDINGYLKSKVRELATAGTDIGLNIPDISRQVWTDVARIDTIISKTAHNAMEFSGPGGKTEIRLVFNSDTYTVIVTGIRPAGQFRHCPRATGKRNALASRFGFASQDIDAMLLRKLVTGLRGDMEYTLDNTGYRFSMTLPVSRDQYLVDSIVRKPENTVMDQAVLTDFMNMPEDTSAATEKILIVEDNDELREYLYFSLKSGYRVYKASDGNDALELLKTVMPDLIVSDIMMPDMRGDILCRKIKNNPSVSHIPVILLTSEEGEEETLNSLESGADLCLVKPVDIAVLRAYIGNMLRSRNRFASDDERNRQLPSDSGEIKETEQEYDFLEKANSLIYKNMSDPEFCIDQLASEMAMSRSVLYKRIKAATGVAPNEYIRHARMRKASGLLKLKRYSISEVSLKVGFSDPKYFSTIFKKYYGQTPSDFISAG